MTIDITKYSAFLEQVAREIDIPPGKYQDAVDRYKAVGRWLGNGEYPDCHDAPDIYVQGSFRLGTVVRPIRGGVEANYDIDLVCQLAARKECTTPQAVKSMVGDRLQEHGVYKEMLDSEGRRCWTLEYAEEDNVGFHLDVLPAVPDAQEPPDNAIAITDKKDSNTYIWSPSNPRGYGDWFESKNAYAFSRVAAEQKQSIQRVLGYASIDEVPNQLVRTALQRSIQLMKRHRDLHFDHRPDRDYAPISIILTTLATHLYDGELDLYSALSGIVSSLQAHAALVGGRTIDPMLATRGLIRRGADGTWYIGNPVDPKENFADRWHEDNHARARAFFAWVGALKRDFLDILTETSPQSLQERLKRTLGAAPVAKHFGALVPSTPPRIQITSPAKPWRRY